MTPWSQTHNDFLFSLLTSFCSLMTTFYSFVLVWVFISAPGLHVYSHTGDTGLRLASGVKV